MTNKLFAGLNLHTSLAAMHESRFGSQLTGTGDSESTADVPPIAAGPVQRRRRGIGARCGNNAANIMVAAIDSLRSYKQKTPAAPAENVEITLRRIPEHMIRVPNGEFLMGSPIQRDRAS